MKRILVTGGAGFIGSHLCGALLAQGHRVTVLDNFSTGHVRRLGDWAGHERLSVAEHDITQPFSGTFDRIYNLACPASPAHYQADPVKTMLTCVAGAHHMLGLAKRCKARILQASTSEIYGNPEQHPQAETYLGNVNPIGPRACYDEGKRAAEALFFDYHRAQGVDIRVARIFNTYGPGMHRYDGRAVANFICQALDGKPLTIYGDGTQTRSFCYIDDMVDGLMRLMESEGATGPVNLGNPEEHTMEELADTIIEITGSASPVSFHPLPQDDPKQRRPDITLAKSVLGWEPKVSLDKGLRKTVAWFKQQMSAAA